MPSLASALRLVTVGGAGRKDTKTLMGVLSSPFPRVGRSRNDQLNGRVALDFVFHLPLLIRALLGAFLPRTKFDMATEAKLLVLRHELNILRARLSDRNFAVAIASCLPPQAL